MRRLHLLLLLRYLLLAIWSLLTLLTELALLALLTLLALPEALVTLLGKGRRAHFGLGRESVLRLTLCHRRPLLLRGAGRWLRNVVSLRGASDHANTSKLALARVACVLLRSGCGRPLST